MKQLTLFPDWDPSDLGGAEINLSQRQQLESKFTPLVCEELKIGKLVSYVGNKNLPILRLYRYKEAFSFALVKEFIDRFELNAETDYLFEPFCGLGTTPFTAMKHNIPAIAIDRLPIATFVASTLPLFSLIEPNTLRETFAELRSKVEQCPPADVALDVKIMKIAFPEEMLLTLRRWKTVIHTLSEPLRQIFLLLFLSILEPCSYTAKDGQFLRMKRDKCLPDPAEILQQKVYEAEQDLLSMRQL